MLVDALLDIDPGAEGAVARRAQHRHVDVVGLPDPLPQPLELVAHPLVEAVHGLWPVEGDRRDVLILGVLHGGQIFGIQRHLALRWASGCPVQLDGCLAAEKPTATII